ncbi:MAG: RNA polymerase factor sigma-54 [Proteobacteria bacterium]|jgi:RNA polymerase sigma-54 factor|nr:RNA polymerase factor sigma-54 [Pseudomonadota bacterium]MDA0926842.1 RNA polymerase factor sigma-54 [Pseudomonadota bacterium]
MKLSLQLKLGQQLTMTPQLQQAIRLLQLSTLDLQQEIHQALESNPMLDMEESNDEDDRPSDEHPHSIDSNDNQKLNGDDSGWEEQIPNELSVDSNWDDIYPTASSNYSSDSDNYDFESRNTAEETLQDHLLWQLNLTPMSERDEAIAMAIIDAIDANGMLSLDLESIHAGFDPGLELEVDEVLAVLHRIQQFDPVGVGYRNLAECLLIQLNQLDLGVRPELIANAKLIIREHLELLGHRDYAQLMRRTRLKESELRDTIAVIESLDPRPGSAIAPPSTSYIVPDVIVTKQADTGKWRVELNPDTAPRIRINDSYAALVKRADTSDDNNYMRDKLQEARWFIKSLQSRNETLMKVATRIVEHQKGFLEYGEEAMKPLVLHDIAEAVGMHESTISRVTTQKYMHTPRGIFELKYFFSSHVSTKGGGECSSTAIRAIIKKLIAAENARKPLSDSKITQLLEEKGINVARRTIAKYRESLSIPPSNERKRLVD